MKAATMRRFAAALMLAVALMLAYPTVGTIGRTSRPAKQQSSKHSRPKPSSVSSLRRSNRRSVTLMPTTSPSQAFPSPTPTPPRVNTMQPPTITTCTSSPTPT